MPNTLEEFEFILLQRNKEMKSSLEKYVSILSSCYMDLFEPYEQFRYYVTNIQPQKDIDEYVHSLSQEVVHQPNAFIFENYAKGNIEQKKTSSTFLSRLFEKSSEKPIEV